MIFDKDKIIQTVKDFREGRLDILNIPNPLWYDGGVDVLHEYVASNFQLWELNVSVASRVKILKPEQAPNLIVYRKLTTTLQTLRDHISAVYPSFSIHVSSGYRSPYINAIIGGAQKSYHTMGAAADVYFSGLENLNLPQDSIRRGVALVAQQMGVRGIELIIDGKSVHFDVIRPGYWYAKQVKNNVGRFTYPLMNTTKDLVPYQLPGL